MNLEVIYFTRKEQSKISVKSRKKIGRNYIQRNAC